MRSKLATTLAVGLALSVTAMPVFSMADGGRQSHRQSTANQWKGISIGSAAVGILGLLTHNNTIAAAGLGGAAYSYYRSDQDQQSANRYSRYDNQYNRNGNQYNRNGNQYGNDNQYNGYSSRGNQGSRYNHNSCHTSSSNRNDNGRRGR